jgi:hypothetical protein
MNRSLILSCFILAVVIMIPITGCAGENQSNSNEVIFEQLISHPEKYNSKNITLEAFYFHGFEIIVLSDTLKYSGYAEGHLIPDGELIWIEGGIPLEVYNQLTQQQMMGPDERYGKVRVKGKFEYGGSYGHVGGYRFQIIPSVVELLPWSPD